ncbi:hypothetical protein K8I31_07545, partial [bacterium]|nr:hypothetical protein [bacterium]
MDRFRNLIGLLTFCLLLNSAYATENLDRGMIAVQRPDGSVFVSWRSLIGDVENQAFQVTKLQNVTMSVGDRIK